ncbi:hypothetical protein LTR84_010414 [Exophiala bonariae]|uniref:MARVEL domain-containing protein n=1 Tax=Exophiala bonariae TaxID=1690606 RepID=A0AAV9MTF1_9EURO|nr:hypothetical protein LTR84_010414 [Exophiala bonariae]
MITTKIKWPEWRYVPFSRIFYLGMNILQSTAGITVVSLCGSDVSENSIQKGRSIFTIVVGILSIITAFSFAVEVLLTMPSRVWLLIVFVWQWLIVALWAISAGLLGGVYLPHGRARMRTATGFAYLNLVLWLLCSIVGTVTCCASGRKKKQRNGADGEVDGGLKPPAQVHVLADRSTGP